MSDPARRPTSNNMKAFSLAKIPVLLQVSKAAHFLADTVGPQHDRRFDVGVPIMSHLDVDLAPHIHLSPTYNEI